MKALLLSAGLGTRLRPITNNIPKVMVPIDGKPCLQYALENLREQGIKNFAINLHYYPEKVKSYFGDGSKFGVRIRYSYEKELLGTAGAVHPLQDFLNERFVLTYSDVVANFNLQRMIEVHERNRALATITLDTRRSQRGKGVVFAEGDKVTSFVEKPDQEIPNAFVNSAFYLFEPAIVKKIPPGFSDFGRDILPRITREGLVYCVRHQGYIFDIGTIDELRRAEDYLSIVKDASLSLNSQRQIGEL